MPIERGEHIGHREGRANVTDVGALRLFKNNPPDERSFHALFLLLYRYGPRAEQQTGHAWRAGLGAVNAAMFLRCATL
jgi:hypothetical protein